MFKNVMAYRIGPNWNATVPEIEAALSANRFTECTPGQDKSVGWTEPRNVANGPLLESIGGQWIAKLLIETKAVPSSVVKRKAEIQAQEIEAQTGRKPGKKKPAKCAKTFCTPFCRKPLPSKAQSWSGSILKTV